MSYPDKMRTDGLCDPTAFVIPARQLMGTVCVAGGAACPLFRNSDDAKRILNAVKVDPAVTMQLTSDADRIPHFTELNKTDYQYLDREGLFNRKRDLDVLQRMGLVPGDTRRARYLYEKLFSVISSPVNICAFSTPGWAGCPLARSGIYEKVHAAGTRELISDRPACDKTHDREASGHRLQCDSALYIRPHHLMCMMCWLEGTKGQGSRSDDTLDLLWRRIQADPAVEIVLVEGNCEACFCCDGFHPETRRCVHSCGLIRDYKKDLDLFQKLGMFPGDRLPATDLLLLILDKIACPQKICGYDNGIITGESWGICGGACLSNAYKRSKTMIKSLV